MSIKSTSILENGEPRPTVPRVTLIPIDDHPRFRLALGQHLALDGIRGAALKALTCQVCDKIAADYYHPSFIRTKVPRSTPNSKLGDRLHASTGLAHHVMVLPDEDLFMSERALGIGGTTYRLACVHGPEMAPLVPLFRKVFRRPDFNLGWLEKKYACQYGGVGGFFCVAFTEGGQAVASFGVLPWPIRFGDRTEIAAQVVDAATDEEHRHRGLFTRLAEMARELCDSAGISFLFGFARPQGGSYQGLVRIGYTHIDDLVEYRLPILTFWVERVARRVGRLHGLYERHLQRTLRAYFPVDPVLDNSLFSEGFAGTHRDRAFHDYKAFAGNRVLAVDGGRVWLKVRRGLLVGDLEASSEAEMEKAVRVLERLAVRLGIHQILFQSSKGTRFSRFFADRFRPFPCLSVIYQNLRSQIPAEKLRFTFGDLDNF